MSADINRWGEYYNETPVRSPGEISDLRRHNAAQDALIQETRDLSRKTYSGLYGVDGKNGLRGEFRSHQAQNEKRQDTLDKKIDQLEMKIDKVIPKIVGAVTATIGALAALAGVISFVVRMVAGSLV